VTKFPMHVDEMYIILSHLGSRKDMTAGAGDMGDKMYVGHCFGGHYLEYILDS
jgi:hypothetical protein